MEKRKQYLGCIRSLFPERGRGEMLDLSSPLRTCWRMPVAANQSECEFWLN